MLRESSRSKNFKNKVESSYDERRYAVNCGYLELHCNPFETDIKLNSM